MYPLNIYLLIYIGVSLCVHWLHTHTYGHWKKVVPRNENERSFTAKPVSSLDSFCSYMEKLTVICRCKLCLMIYWLRAQRWDLPLILFEAIWLTKAFVSLLLDVFISYLFLGMKTSLLPVALLAVTLEVLCS
jgi:hypothetical protein